MQSPAEQLPVDRGQCRTVWPENLEMHDRILSVHGETTRPNRRLHVVLWIFKARAKLTSSGTLGAARSRVAVAHQDPHVGDVVLRY